MQAPETERLLQYFVKEDAVLRAYVHAATRNHQDTEDILQEVWRTLTVKLDQFDKTRSFRAWALGVARLQVLKWRQSLGRSREYPSETVLERKPCLNCWLTRRCNMPTNWIFVRSTLGSVWRSLRPEFAR